MTIYKTAKKVARKARGIAIKRYFNKGYQPKLGQMGKDIKYLKDQINAEKKRLTMVQYSTAGTQGANVVGQNYNTNVGYIVQDITPKPAEGVTFYQRSGSSIKLSSSYFMFQTYQQSETAQAIGLDLYVVLVKGSPVTDLNAFVQNMFTYNPFIITNYTNTYDTNSPLNPDYFGTYRILRKKKIYVKSDNNLTDDPIQIVNAKMGMKYARGQGHHIRFDKDTTTVRDGQLLMIVLASNGNCGASVNSGTVPVTSSTTNTGLVFNYNITHYFYDN